jgi:hypothetical protein
MKSWMAIIAAFSMLAVLVWAVCFCHKSTASPSLEKKWQRQVFALDEGEVARLIPRQALGQRNYDLISEFNGMHVHYVPDLNYTEQHAAENQRMLELVPAFWIPPPKYSMDETTFVFGDSVGEREKQAMVSILRQATKKEIVTKASRGDATAAQTRDGR